MLSLALGTMSNFFFQHHKQIAHLSCYILFLFFVKTVIHNAPTNEQQC